MRVLHEWKSDQGWWVCPWCGRTTKDRSLYEDVSCKRPEGAPEERVFENSWTWDRVEKMAMSQAVSDASRAKIPDSEIWRAVQDNLIAEMEKKNRWPIGEPTLRKTPMTTMPGYTTFVIEQETVEVTKAEVSDVVSPQTFGGMLPGAREDHYAEIMERRVNKMFRNYRHNRNLVKVTYEDVSWGSGPERYITATLWLIPRPEFQNYGKPPTIVPPF